MKPNLAKLNVSNKKHNKITQNKKIRRIKGGLYLTIFLIITSLLTCGCTEMKIKTTNNINKTHTVELTNHTNINIETKTLQPEKANLSYEILAYGSFGSKERTNYFYYLDNKTVIVINLGEMPTSGYIIKILNITREGNNITVYYTIIPPKNATAMVITYPYIKLYVNGTFDNVIFKEK
ncbi:MAG: protease complex subunit PrcB family protein [Methanococci archaeon]|nr:protease complex subunit PrcB family protein [Methanococci archaeon]